METNETPLDPPLLSIASYLKYTRNLLDLTHSAGTLASLVRLLIIWPFQHTVTQLFQPVAIARLFIKCMIVKILTPYSTRLAFLAVPYSGIASV